MLILIYLISYVFGDDQLQIVQPKSLVSLFGGIGLVPEKPALFGIPPFGRSITGKVVYGTPGDLDGCSPIDKSLLPSASQTLILMVDRGNCSFVTKVLNAQIAGAHAAIVVNNNDDILPYMGDDGHGDNVYIPSMIITNSSGASIKAHMAESVIATMTWNLPNPDNRVEWTMWTSSYDVQSEHFKAVFGEAVKKLGDNALFTPEYYIINGEAVGCRDPVGYCGSQCTNEGRYCLPDPEHNLTYGINGSQLVEETLRQICIYQTLVPNNKTEMWWDYVSKFNVQCAPDPYKWTEACSNSILTALKISTTAVKNCYTQSGGTTDDSQNTLLDAQITKGEDSGIFYLPTIFINNAPYRGSVNCLEPLDVSSCGPLEAICAGYEPGKPLPCACNSNPGCELCVARDSCGVCGGDGNSCSSTTVIKNPVSAGAIAAIVIICIVAVGAIVYFVIKRQQEKMRNDIDALLAQYHQLEDKQTGTTQLLSQSVPSDVRDI